jgi:hypothetical protein
VKFFFPCKREDNVVLVNESWEHGARRARVVACRRGPGRAGSRAAGRPGEGRWSGLAKRYSICFGFSSSDPDRRHACGPSELAVACKRASFSRAAKASNLFQSRPPAPGVRAASVRRRARTCRPAGGACTVLAFGC